MSVYLRARHADRAADAAAVRWAGDRPPGTVRGIPSDTPLLTAFEARDLADPPRLGPAPLGPRDFRAGVSNERWFLRASPVCRR